MTPSTRVVREAVKDALKSGRSFYDYWYYTMTPQQHALFDSLRNFEGRCDAAYHNELLQKEDREQKLSVSIETYWKEKQGDEYGSY